MNYKRGKIINKKAYLCYLLPFICSTLLVFACDTTINKPMGKPSWPEKPLNPGMGTFTLNIGDSNTHSRTIMPSDNAFTFTHYKLDFYLVNTMQLVKSFFMTEADNNKTVEIEAGTYNVVITAFTSEEKMLAQKPAANGRLEGVNIPINNNVVGTVTLKPIIDNGQGTFSWNITLPNDLSKAEMAITSLPGGLAINISPINLLGNTAPNRANHSLELAAGYYRIVFTLEKANAVTVTWRETLHVYQNIESNFTYVFTDYHFIVNSYTVTFVYNDGVTPNAEYTYFHGAGIVKLNPSRTGYTFDGWYRDNETFINKWNFATDMVDGNITLYAKWLLNLGTGTADDPFKVTTIEDLQHVGKPTNNGSKYDNWTLDKHYEQLANINMTGQTYTEIGSNTSPFTGSYNGNGYTITGLTINKADFCKNQGMFGYIDKNSTVSNVTLINVSVICTGDNIGGVVGYNGGTVTNCYSTGSVSGTRDYIGGIVGYNSGTVQNCSVTGNVNSTSQIIGGVGGIAGLNYTYGGYGGTVQNCYFTGTVSSEYTVGGIVGWNSQGSTVQNCYVTGNVSGNAYIGGIVGDNYGTVQNCYVTGTVNAGGTAGGIVGITNNNYGTIQNCVALNNSVTNSSYTIGRVIGYTNNKLVNNYAWNNMPVTTSDTWTPDKRTNGKDGADLTFSAIKTKSAWITAGFLFVDSSPTSGPWIWHGNNGDFMPSLSNEKIQWPDIMEDGTADDPFKVTTIEDLQHVGKPTNNGSKYDNWTLDKHYEQLANINMTGQTYTAIGSNTSPFTGSYNGNGYTITGLTINTPYNRAYQGMFGYIISSGRTLSNIVLININIKEGMYVGGVVGYNRGVTIQNCYVTGSVSGIYYVGGIVGYNQNSKVQNCYSISSVIGSSNSSSSDYIGGIVGINDDGAVQNCYVTGSVSGTGENIGGVVGYNNNHGAVQNCVALNNSMETTKSTSVIGRVIGFTYGPQVNNYAWNNMSVITNGTWTPDKTTSGKDGADVSAGTGTGQYNNQSFWQSTMGWSFGTSETSPWKWNNTTKLPKLWFEQ